MIDHAIADEAAGRGRSAAKGRRRAARHAGDRGHHRGGADWTLLRSDGVLELDLRISLQTHDGALISLSSFGLRHGPPEVIAAIGRGESVDPASYYFRTTPRFETGYAYLNRLIAVASCDRRPGGPLYTIDEVQ